MVAVALSWACARAVSTTPLGGEEWVREERHFDRRAGGKVDPLPNNAPKPAHTAAAEAPAQLSRPELGLVTEPREVRFGFVPFTRGNTITLETTFKIRALLSTSFQGLSTSQNAELDARKRIEVKVIDALPDSVRELEVHYVDSKSVFRFGDSPADEDSNAGKRYRVTFADGKPRVMRDRGTLEPGEDKGVIFDLGSVTGYIALARTQLPITLLPGASSRVDALQLASIFGSLDAVKLESASFRLRGPEAKRAEIALFDCGLGARIDRDGATFVVDLKGSCSVRATDSRPLEIRLSGPLQAAEGAAFTSASTLTGTVEAQMVHSYSAETR